MSSESLANRIVRLLSANAHAMLDSLEGRNPEAMMNQFVDFLKGQNVEAEHIHLESFGN